MLSAWYAPAKSERRSDGLTRGFIRRRTPRRRNSLKLTTLPPQVDVQLRIASAREKLARGMPYARRSLNRETETLARPLLLSGFVLQGEWR